MFKVILLDRIEFDTFVETWQILEVKKYPSLVNSPIDAKALSSYYVSSDLIPVIKKRKKVLQWLEAN